MIYLNQNLDDIESNVKIAFSYDPILTDVLESAAMELRMVCTQLSDSDMINALYDGGNG